MVAVVFLHMVRVFLTGAYRNGTATNQSRPVNWIIGVVLLLVTLILNQSTLGTGRTTVLQGVVHLVLFAAFLFLAIVP